MNGAKKLVLAAGIALLAWGAMDLFGWLTTGQQLMENYAELQAVHDLLNRLLYNGVAKIVFGTAAVIAAVLKRHG